MRIGYKLSFPDGEYKDHVFSDWDELCKYLSSRKEGTKETILIDMVILMDGDER